MTLYNRRILVTGGAGFIGSAFIRLGLKKFPSLQKIINLDLLTYAANLESLAEIEKDPRYLFVQGDVCDAEMIERLCIEHNIDSIAHFAAESHVDKSIMGPRAFFETNVRGTFCLLEVVRKLPHIHFHHVSTDEVYGSLGEEGCFTENSPYAPNSPYSASKAASDHFVRAYTQTYGLSTTMSHCTNNYGPFQHVEKFLPRMIQFCIEEKPLCLYGNGANVRDWLYVDDHAQAIWTILEKGKKGEVYGIGGNCEKSNIAMLHLLIQEVAICLDKDPREFENRVVFVEDRPGHDFRYAMDTSKIERCLGWRSHYPLKEGLRTTVEWYLKNSYVKQ